MIQEEEVTWSGMVDDFNIVDNFKSEIVDNLNEIENMWAFRNPDYKPFKLLDHDNSPNEELNSNKDFNIQEGKQIEDQYPFIIYLIFQALLKLHTKLSIFLSLIVF